MRFAAVAALALAACSASRVSIERLDPRFDALVPPGARVERVASGFTWVEGPVWHPDGYLLFSDIPENRVLRWTAKGGAGAYLERSGYTGAAPFEGREPGSNGLLLDPQRRLVLCQHGDRRLARLEPDGTVTVLADRYEGRRLNSPNDVATGPGGALFFTDPPFGLARTFDDPAKELPHSGVYRLGADGRLSLLAKDLPAPNGLAFSPDGKTLYVSNADPARPVWMAYPVAADGTLGEGRVFFDATAMARTRPGLPDGLEVDERGNLFAAGPGGIYVFAPDGTHLGTVLLNVPTSNCAFGGDGRDLYVTADTAVYRLRLATRG